MNPENGFCVLKLHYTAHPDRRDPSWAEENRRKYAPEQWQREQEIDFTAGHGIPAFASAFSKELILPGESTHIPGQKIYRGWDWGFQHPAMVAGQFDDKGRMCIFLESMGTKVQARTFIKRCVMLSRGVFAYQVEGKHLDPDYDDWADWSGDHSTDKSPLTTMDIARSEGVFPKTKKMLKRVGYDLTLDLLKSGRLLIHESCTTLIRGFQGEYALDERRDVPENDGYFEHMFDALRYLLLGANLRIQRPKRFSQPRLQRAFVVSRITGY